jgi:5-(carboxyamino)imidazole ribonucleotide synthase
VIAPGGTIGILGGGQLGRMTAMAAARLGYRSVILAPDAEAPAADVAGHHLQAAYDDPTALAELIDRVDVVTLEWENVPVAALERLALACPVRPGAAVLEVTQDRLAEKRFLEGLGMPTAPFIPVDDAAGLETALAAIGPHAILKTRRLGYDGKGQVRLGPGSAPAAAPAAAMAALHGAPAILEGLVTFERELSVITARRPSGEMRSFPPVENRHAAQILIETIVPAELPEAIAGEAVAMAERIARALDLEGLLAVEMFLAADGRLLVNELAPRPHNSGHWSLDACAVSQFEQLVRAICDLPLGEPTPTSPCTMQNLIGDAVDAWPAILAEPGARLHLYGKREVRPGRKMGHVTRLRAV